MVRIRPGHKGPIIYFFDGRSFFRILFLPPIAMCVLSIKGAFTNHVDSDRGSAKSPHYSLPYVNGPQRGGRGQKSLKIGPHCLCMPPNGLCSFYGRRICLFLIFMTLFITNPIFFSRTLLGCLSRKEIVESVKQSLKNLGFDYIDLVIIHKYDANCPIEGMYLIISNFFGI